MKPISELKISPWPWRPYGWNGELGQRCWTVESSRQTTVCEINRNEDTHPDACLLAAAPELYGELWKVCFGHSKTINCRKCEGDKLGNCSECTLGGARAALAKAAGEWGAQ